MYTVFTDMHLNKNTICVVWRVVILWLVPVSTKLEKFSTMKPNFLIILLITFSQTMTKWKMWWTNQNEAWWSITKRCCHWLKYLQFRRTHHKYIFYEKVDVSSEEYRNQNNQVFKHRMHLLMYSFYIIENIQLLINVHKKNLSNK